MSNGNGKKKEGDSSEGFLESMEESFKKSYAGRLKKARDMQRQAEVRAEAEALRAATTQEDAEKKIAELKRGSAINIAEICGAAVAGLALGIVAQKTVDVRVQGVPVDGALGLAGIGMGLGLDEDFPVRAVFAVGGTMFIAGTVAYAWLNPAPATDSETQGV